MLKKKKKKKGNNRYERLYDESRDEAQNIHRCSCGAKAKLVCEGVIDIVRCTKCDNASPPFWDAADLAIETWNKQQSEAANEKNKVS